MRSRPEKDNVVLRKGAAGRHAGVVGNQRVWIDAMHMRGGFGAHVRVCSGQVVGEACAHSPRHRVKVVVAASLCREDVRGVSGKAGSVMCRFEPSMCMPDKETILTHGRPRRAPECSGPTELCTPLTRVVRSFTVCSGC